MGQQPHQRNGEMPQTDPLPNHIPNPSDENANNSAVFMLPFCPYGTVVFYLQRSMLFETSAKLREYWVA
jgi:hypothetical protein